jgi:putative ABC transport system permease protein
MEIPIMAGRGLSEHDVADSEPVIVLSKALADRAWPDENPIGKRIRIDTQGDSIWRTVVGVAGDVKYRIEFSDMLMFYVPHAQRPAGGQYLVLKTSVDPMGLVAPIRGLLTELDPNTPITVRPLEAHVSESSAIVSSRFVILVLGSLSVLAGMLAVVGVYGVLAYSVQQRSREIGIQIALGAEKGKVLAGVMRRGLLLALIGLGSGGVIALAAARFVESQLFGIQPRDPMTLLGVAVLVAVSVAAASYIPARRAARMDPAEVLRAE